MTEITGTLESWEDVQEVEAWGGLLIGNGMSIGVWPDFAYSSLYDHATSLLLDPVDQALFEQTPNFERVLADLNTAMRVTQKIGVHVPELLTRFHRIQQALGTAVNEVHLARPDVPDSTLEQIRESLICHDWIFTTSYDLLLYWAILLGGRPQDFRDYFMCNGRREFVADKAEVGDNDRPVYYLHGALHLVAGGTGATWKRKWKTETLLEQFGRPIDGDERARPLLVTEGSARDKMRAIEGNRYLSHALGRLRECDVPLVVFGSALSEQDAHLLDAIGEHPERPVAVSMRPGPPEALKAKQAAIVGRLSSESITFFDSETHPLGSPSLRVRREPPLAQVS